MPDGSPTSCAATFCPFLAILVYLGWSPVAQSLVRPLLVVELHVSIDPSSY